MTRKQFRYYLNEKFPANPATNHKHHRYQQKTRAYGDYLWHQDRSMFEADYQEHLAKQGGGLTAPPHSLETPAMDETNEALKVAAEIAERIGASLGEPAIGAAIAKEIRKLIR